MKQILLALALLWPASAYAETRVVTLDTADGFYGGALENLTPPSPGPLYVRFDFDPSLVVDIAYFYWNGVEEYVRWDPIGGNDPPYQHNTIDASVTCLFDDCFTLTAPGRLEATLTFPSDFEAPTCDATTVGDCSRKYIYAPGLLQVFFTGPVSGPSLSATFTFSSTPISAVPEPATWAMLIAGFGLTGTLLRRSRRFVAA